MNDIDSMEIFDSFYQNPEKISRFQNHTKIYINNMLNYHVRKITNSIKIPYIYLIFESNN